MRNRINELYNTIATSNTELEEIRKNCKHNEGFSVKLFSWRIGSMKHERLCNICDTVLPGITEEEIEEWCSKEGLNF